MTERRMVITMTVIAVGILIYIRFVLGIAWLDVLDRHIPCLVCQ